VRAVHKFPLTGPQSCLAIPPDGEILSVGVQTEKWGDPYIVVWALVDPDASPGDGRVVRAVNTGAPAPEGTFLGTVTVESIVWHLFAD
jgi:hypothetical protein